eukprot:1868434-Pyramimonas_sp.AAC.1
MAKAVIFEDASKFNSCTELYKYYQGSQIDAARTGRAFLDDLMSENPDTFLINVVRQLPPTNDGGFCRRAANFWVALWIDRAQRNTREDISDSRVSQSVEK